jgi:hypothetical protein
MYILNLLWDWRFIIAAIIAFLVYCWLDWKEAKSRLYATMLRAKSLAKDAVLKSGQEQEEWVVKKAYQLLPLKFKIFISEERLRQIVHWLYHTAKDMLDDNKLNNSI